MFGLSGLFCLPGRGQSVPGTTAAGRSLLPVLPDSATRTLYQRMRVRAVAKVRLNAEGDVRDTLFYQQVDPVGRLLTRVEYLPARARQQWSYDAQGHCTNLIQYPTPTQPATHLFAYNPALGRSTHQLLTPDGRLLPLSETTLLIRADTLLTETCALRTLTGAAVPDTARFQRALRLQLHPDTVLLLRTQHTRAGQLLRATAAYQFSRQGFPYESGELDLTQAARLPPRPGPKAGNKPLDYSRLMQALRTAQGLRPRQWWRYDARNRLVQHSSRQRTNRPHQVVDVVVTYTYNTEDQLIAQEQRIPSMRGPGNVASTAFSYLPTGLPLGETSNLNSRKPIFYRYLYQYYE
jgi:hypothetical protein